MVAPARRRHARTPADGKQSGSQSQVETGQARTCELRLTPGDASSYVLSMVAELRSIAIAAEFRFLAYLLEIAFQEAYRLEEEFGREGKSKAQERGSAV
jgi:hypothetical protein